MSDLSAQGPFRTNDDDAPEDAGIPPGRSVFGPSAEPVTEAASQWQTTTGATLTTGHSARSEPTLQEADSQEMEVWNDYSTDPQWANEQEHLPPVEPQETVGGAEQGEDFFGYDDKAHYNYGAPNAAAGERDMPMAVLVGVIMAAAILVAMWFSPAAALVVVVVVLGLASVEFFNALRVAEYQPAVLLGLASVVSMPLAVYWRGLSAVVPVLVLTVIFGALWYLTGVGTGGALRGLASTILSVAYIGVCGSHAALILAIPDHGTGLLMAAILFTVAYDVGGMVVGRAAGRNPLSQASPNKTLEGLVGGCLITLAVGLIMGLLALPTPVADGPGDIWTALLLAASAAIAAPIGDLAESLIKRDLEIKDMSTLLPGHGGLLDRFDGMLFVLPITYYVALVAEVI